MHERLRLALLSLALLVLVTSPSATATPAALLSRTTLRKSSTHALLYALLLCLSSHV
jgi:hypothetical protein